MYKFMFGFYSTCSLVHILMLCLYQHMSVFLILLKHRICIAHMLLFLKACAEQYICHSHAVDIRIFSTVCLFSISKTRLFKYTENFTTKK